MITTKKNTNIILIGMPGSGKSTVGVILAKALAMGFVDTDLLIQTDEGRSLQEIVNNHGYMALRKTEERVLLNINCENQIIATGGSAVYSHPAMDHLKSRGVIIFLDVDLPVLESRIDNFQTRGLARQRDQGLEDLFMERIALYKKYADITVECSDLSQEEVCREIIKVFSNYS